MIPPAGSKLSAIEVSPARLGDATGPVTAVGVEVGVGVGVGEGATTVVFELVSEAVGLATLVPHAVVSATSASAGT
jgi:hypothetical protein